MVWYLKYSLYSVVYVSTVLQLTVLYPGYGEEWKKLPDFTCHSSLGTVAGEVELVSLKLIGDR